MQCPACQHENSPRVKFCEECATPLARTCPNCAAQTSFTAKFARGVRILAASEAPQGRYASRET